MYARATRLELDGSFDGAFKLYIKAAGEFIRVSRSSQDPAFRERIKADASRALQRAEQIKLRKQNIITPVAKDHFAEGKVVWTLRGSVADLRRGTISRSTKVICSSRRLVPSLDRWSFESTVS